MGAWIGNVVFDVPAQTLDVFARSARTVAAMYAELLGMRLRSRLEVYREAGYEPRAEALEECEADPLVLDDDPHHPNIAFESSVEYRAPRWPDPSHPQQAHLDIGVRELGAADHLVRSHGANLVLVEEDHRTYTDAVGHPFCLYPTAGRGSTDRARIVRIVFDCLSPRSLANFYEDLLDMNVRLVDTPRRVELASADRTLPALAFQQVWHIPPTWPDPRYPQQLHVDFAFDEVGAEVLQARAERLGALRLPFQGGGFVFADPAGHPFCLGE